jgi:flagellar hook-length control protein FliK
MAQGQPAVDAQAANAALATQAAGIAAKPAAGMRADAGLNTDPALPGATESRTKGLQRAMGQTRSDKAAAVLESNLAGSTPAQTRPQHDFKLFAAMEAQRNLQSAPEPELVLAALGGQGEKSTAERSLFAKQSSDAAYPVAGLDAGSVEFSSSAPLEVAPVLETQAAEQVKYWISQDVQNAELKLDGLGENPVEVSISMHGNEAHVSFRTDELQTHSLLEGAGAQLKDMLLREGVVLTGVSVGTSGTNDGKGGERRPRQGVKIVQVTAAQTAPMEVPRRLAGTAGRSVDLFV